MNISTPALGLLLPLLLAACTSVAQPPAAPSGGSEAERAAATAERRVQDEANLPKVELSEEILFGILASELAAQRGQVASAAPTYLELAQETRDPRVARRAAEMALAAGNLDGAINALSLWSAIDPDSTAARQQLALALARSGHFSDARQLIDALLADKPAAAPQLFLQLAALAPRQQDKRANYLAVRDLADRFTRVPEAGFALASAATEAGEQEVADTTISQLARTAPKWEVPVFWRLERLRQLAPELAGPFIQRAAAERPGASMDLKLAYPRLLVSEKRYDEAMTEFGRLEAQMPSQPDLLYALGILAFQRKDYALAEQKLSAARDAGYRDGEFIELTLGQLAEAQKDFDVAEKHYRAVAPGQNYPQAQARLAGLEARRGQLNAALARLEGLSSMVEDPSQLELWRAQLARDAKQTSRAYAILSAGLKRYPTSLGLWYERGMLAEQQGRHSQAEYDLRRALKLKPDEPQVLNALGYTLTNRGGRHKEALVLIEKALAGEPDSPMIQDSMGWVLHHLGRYEEARGWLEKAYKAQPDGEIAAHLGEVLWKLGRRGEAEALLRAAHAAEPDNAPLLDTMRRLKLLP